MVYKFFTDDYLKHFGLLENSSRGIWSYADPCAVADRLWVKDHLDPEEEKLQFSN